MNEPTLRPNTEETHSTSLEEQVSFLDTLIFGRHQSRSALGQLHSLNNDAFILKNHSLEEQELGEGWEVLCYDNFSSYEKTADIPEDADSQWYVMVIDGLDGYRDKVPVSMVYAKAMGMCGLIPERTRAIAVVGDTLVPHERMNDELGKHGLGLLLHLDFRDGEEHHFNPLIDGKFIHKGDKGNTLVIWKGISERYSELFSERELIMQHYIKLCIDTSHLLGMTECTYENITRTCFSSEYVSAMAKAIEIASFGTQSLPEQIVRDAAPRNPDDRKRAAKSPLREVLFVPTDGPARQIASISAVRMPMMRAWYGLASAAHLRFPVPPNKLPVIPEMMIPLIEASGLRDAFEQQLKDQDPEPLLDKIRELRGEMMVAPSEAERNEANKMYMSCCTKTASEYNGSKLAGKPSEACEIIASIEASLAPNKLGPRATGAPRVMLFGSSDPVGASPLISTPCHDFGKVCEIYNELFENVQWSLIVAPPMSEREQSSLGLCAVALGLVPQDHAKLVVACGQWELLPEWKLEGWAERFEKAGIRVIGDVDGILEDYGYHSSWEEELIINSKEENSSTFILRDKCTPLPEITEAVGEAFPAKLLSATRGVKLPFVPYDITESAMKVLSCGQIKTTSERCYPEESWIRVIGKPYPSLPMLDIFPDNTALVKKPEWAATSTEYRDLLHLWNAALEPMGVCLDMTARHRCFSLLKLAGDICGVNSFTEAYYMGIPVDELVM